MDYTILAVVFFVVVGIVAVFAISDAKGGDSGLIDHWSTDDLDNYTKSVRDDLRRFPALSDVDDETLETIAGAALSSALLVDALKRGM